jgi:hypothetical protein
LAGSSGKEANFNSADEPPMLEQSSTGRTYRRDPTSPRLRRGRLRMLCTPRRSCRGRKLMAGLIPAPFLFILISKNLSWTAALFKWMSRPLVQSGSPLAIVCYRSRIGTVMLVLSRRARRHLQTKRATVLAALPGLGWCDWLHGSESRFSQNCHILESTFNPRLAR